MIDLINLRIFGIAILVASIGLVTLGSQAALATEYIMLDADEAAMTGNNTTNMTIGNMNQTESENMTSMMDNSTG